MKLNSNKSVQFLIFGMGLLIVILGVKIWYDSNRTEAPSEIEQSSSQENMDIPEQLSSEFPEVDYSNSQVSFDQILSGGPGRDGIPAITDPKFVSLKESETPDTTRGLYIKINKTEKFYPYNILVWHEIVNDSIDDQAYAVTFCPLCGSAVVFNRSVGGGAVEFGVSGFLYESNMIMYDRTDSPTLWSQSLGEGIVGDKTGQQLERLEFQLLELATVKSKYPSTRIMSTDTGHSRSYDVYPYGNYGFEEDLLFPVSVEDKRYSAKEIFYILPLNNNAEESTAIRIGEMVDGVNYEIDDEVTVTKLSTGEITATNRDSQTIPGYFEMWFSWATHHQEDGTVWEPKQ